MISMISMTSMISITGNTY